MSSGYVPPEHGLSAFNCPRCGAYAHQTWLDMSTGPPGDNPTEGTYFIQTGRWNTPMSVAFCRRCKTGSYWFQAPPSQVGPGPWRMVVPARASGPAPHQDMPPDVREDYDEAREIAARSPRAAAALLRLALEKLCSHLLDRKVKPDEGVGLLVQAGLHPDVQRAADTLRVIGNEAVHAGVMDLRDDLETVLKLFHLVNVIVQDRITQPAMIAGLYEALPPGKLDAIAKRDAASREAPDPAAQAEEERRRRTPPPTLG